MTRPSEHDVSLMQPQTRINKDRISEITQGSSLACKQTTPHATITERSFSGCFAEMLEILMRPFTSLATKIRPNNEQHRREAFLREKDCDGDCLIYLGSKTPIERAVPSLRVAFLLDSRFERPEEVI